MSAWGLYPEILKIMYNIFSPRDWDVAMVTSKFQCVVTISIGNSSLLQMMEDLMNKMRPVVTMYLLNSWNYVKTPYTLSPIVNQLSGPKSCPESLTFDPAPTTGWNVNIKLSLPNCIKKQAEFKKNQQAIVTYMILNSQWTLLPIIPLHQKGVY